MAYGECDRRRDHCARGRGDLEGDGIGKGGSVIGETMIFGHASDAGRGLGACARAEELGGAWE